ncbi:Putative SOS response-associated peptidase YedK [Pseudooceanicola antarcticus]|uniref:Abasic site processing protein n=1 Tax=Pseudooceanicola antarcticus TaxID=1247613 RepID=A0A285JIK2_9RHOB|nr:SOS response-associated peptidase [Pseudooceanicola antarcticus]PJE26454.1 SOS response-associated peptidase [Pseudooceanicola antarcticus]SNY59627.1 Putative SOS response-associated peptidase YedK [Pseudooceanicola antarcticus]
MCGRIANTLPHDAMARLFQAQPANDLPEVPDFNICPTQDLPVILAGAGEGARRMVPMRWGFLPHWYKSPTDGPLLINARAETVADKPAFREACRQRRCLVAVSGFYEWHREGGRKLPYFFSRADGAPLVMAGIWQNWGEEPQPTLALLTTSANALMAPVHHRMPVVLEPENWPLWLGEAGHGAARLMQPAAEEVLQSWRVSPEVNSNRAEGPELIEPWEEA